MSTAGATAAIGRRSAPWCSRIACIATSISIPSCSRSRWTSCSRKPGSTWATRAKCRSRRLFCTDIGREPVLMVRHTDDTVHVVRNRCAHKGTRLVSDTQGNVGKFFRCPYHAWTYRTDGSLLAIPLKARVCADALCRVRERARAGAGGRDAQLSRLRVRPARGGRAGFRRVFRRFALLDRLPGRPLAGGRAGSGGRRAALHARLQLEDVRRESERHDAPDDRA